MTTLVLTGYCSHPVPDESSVRAAEAALARLSALHDDQQALVLVSGGGSALLCAPDGVTLGQNYPQPIIMHDVARALTLQRYAGVKKSLPAP